MQPIMVFILEERSHQGTLRQTFEGLVMEKPDEACCMRPPMAAPEGFH